MQIEIISNMPKKVNLKALKIYADALLNASDIDDIENLYSLCSYELRQIYTFFVPLFVEGAHNLFFK